MKALPHSKYGILVSLVLAGILVGCGTSDERSSSNSEVPSTMGMNGGSTEPLPPSSEGKDLFSGSQETSNLTEDFLLAETISLMGTGGGYTPACNEVRSVKPPDVFIKSRGVEGVVLLEHSSVCLTGFDLDQVIEVSVTVGNSTYYSTIRPQLEALPSAKASREHAYLVPPESLFDGKEMAATAGTGFIESEEWRFVPPLPVRDKIVEAKNLTITATQGKTHASTTHKIDDFLTKNEPGQMVVAWGKDGGKSVSRALAIWGFKAGSRIPIGVYSDPDPEAGDFHLIREIGYVTIPRSGLAVFPFPPSVVTELSTGKWEFCVAGPFKVVEDCYI